MTTPTLTPRLSTRHPVALLRRLWTIHPPLMLSALVTATLTLFFIVGIVADPRVITGQPAWLKPAKFGVSITLYTFTITWLLGFVRTETRARRRLVAALGWTIAAMFAVELPIIVLQVVRGTTSHFNVATPLDAALFSTMGLAIVVLWLANLAVTVLLLREPLGDRPGVTPGRAFALSLRLGLIVTTLGMALGFLMTSPTAQQLAGWRAGALVTIAGAHSVGVPDGGPGLPLVGWSREGGDLRVGHFIGMHALQVLPFVGWFASRRRRLSAGRRVALVAVVSAGYLGLTGLVTWQALRAQPLFSPDALTLGALAALAAVVGAALVAIGAAPRTARRAFDLERDTMNS